MMRRSLHAASSYQHAAARHGTRVKSLRVRIGRSSCGLGVHVLRPLGRRRCLRMLSGRCVGLAAEKRKGENGDHEQQSGDSNRSPHSLFSRHFGFGLFESVSHFDGRFLHRSRARAKPRLSDWFHETGLREPQSAFLSIIFKCPRITWLTLCSLFVLLPQMAIETIGQALIFSWRVTVRCAWGNRDGMKTVRRCTYGEELDLKTLVWTRGSDFPLARLESRLKCPRCGSRRVRLAFSVPPTDQAIRSQS